MGAFQASHTGFFGKLPARGDFVRAGLPEDFVEPLDLWCRACLTASQAILSEAWESAWMTAPVWHFLLAAGACGPRAALGVWMPSIDRAGRHYPFVLCALAETSAHLAEGADWTSMAEQAGLACVVDDAPSETLASRLAAPVADAPLPTPGWWTRGNDLVRPKHLAMRELISSQQAGAMLSDASAAAL